MTGLISGRWRAVAAVIAICLPVAAAAVVFAVRLPTRPVKGPLSSTDSQAALAAARASVHTILSYDYRQIDSDIAAAKADTTGLFATQYSASAPRLLSEATQLKAIVQATVGASGVVSTSRSDVVALLFVDQATVRQTPGEKTPTTRIDQSRVQVTMTNVGGNWRVSELQAL